MSFITFSCLNALNRTTSRENIPLRLVPKSYCSLFLLPQNTFLLQVFVAPASSYLRLTLPLSRHCQYFILLLEIGKHPASQYANYNLTDLRPAYRDTLRGTLRTWTADSSSVTQFPKA